MCPHRSVFTELINTQVWEGQSWPQHIFAGTSFPSWVPD